MKTNYQIQSGFVVSNFTKTPEGVIHQKSVFTPFDKALPCRMTILKWRKKQIKKIIRNEELLYHNK